MQGKKLMRFAEIKTFKNVLEFPEEMKNKWVSHFQNSNPLIIELACGKGEYTVNMAKALPEKNFIGVDIKGNRMYVGAKRALNEEIENVAFLRTRIEQIDQYFDEQSVGEIWITFPDPFLRDGKAKNRLTHHKFLALYQKILAKDGIVHLKTDSPQLFEFTKEMVMHHRCEIVQLIDNIYANGTPAFPLNIQTYYEGMHLLDNRTIQYISFKLPKTPIVIPPKKKKDETQAAI